MSRGRTVVALCVALAVSGCGNEQIGRSVPSCDPNQAGSTLLLAAQSVADAEYVPCVVDLKAGWEYEHLEAKRGRAVFWLSSDRVGERFVEVTLAPACDLGDAVQITSDEPGVPLFVDVERSDAVLSVVVIPEGAEGINRGYALRVADALSEETVRDRSVRVTVDASNDPTEDRLSRALEPGNPALVVGTREQEEGAVELHIPGRTGDPPRLPLGDALEEIEDTLGAPRYRATWHYLFRSGCVTYEFDAKGAGIEALPGDVQEALGLYPLDPLREWGEELGYELP
jgi:hypothetical protein